MNVLLSLSFLRIIYSFLADGRVLSLLRRARIWARRATESAGVNERLRVMKMSVRGDVERAAWKG